MMDLRTQMGLYIWVLNFYASLYSLSYVIHAGHALNKILKDIINRFQVLLGKRVKCVTYAGDLIFPHTTEAIYQVGIATVFQPKLKL